MLNTKFTNWPNSQIGHFPSCDGTIDELVQGVLDSVPRRRKRATCRDLLRQTGIERRQSWRKHPAVGFGEEHGDTAAQTCELVSMRVRNLGDEALPLQAAQVVGRLPPSVRTFEERAN